MPHDALCTCNECCAKYGPVIDSYQCETCHRPVYYNYFTWLHSDDQTPANTCTGYPLSNVTLIPEP